MGPKTVSAVIRKWKKNAEKNRKCALEKLKHQEIWKNKQYLLGKESARDQRRQNILGRGARGLQELLRVSSTVWAHRPRCPTAQGCPVVSAGVVGQQGPIAGSGALNTTVPVQVLSKEVSIIVITPKVMGENTALPINRKLDLRFTLILSMVPPIRTRPSFPHSQSLSSGSFLKPLILINQRANRMKTKSQKTNQTDHMNHSLV